MRSFVCVKPLSLVSTPNCEINIQIFCLDYAEPPFQNSFLVDAVSISTVFDTESDRFFYIF